MDEIKPVEGTLLVDGRVVLVDENYPAQRKEGASLYSQQAIDTLWAEVEALRAKTACTMGVGAGDGQLFVHGDYDSIKAAQALVFRAERAEAEADSLRRDADRYRLIRKHCDLLEMMDSTIIGWQLYNNGCVSLDERVDSWAKQLAAIDAAKQAAD